MAKVANSFFGHLASIWVDTAAAISGYRGGGAVGANACWPWLMEAVYPLLPGDTQVAPDANACR